jgi:predicted glutamine amidotransferase
MCCILILPAGFMPPKEMIQNVTWNNPDGYGLILKDSEAKRIQVIKKTPNEGYKENDPEEIYTLLEDNKDIDRYLHVRYRTVGPIDVDNQHPFTAFYSDKRQVYFMHNGTLNDYKPAQVYQGGHLTQSNDTISDSKKFNDDILFPLLNVTLTANGKGDYTDKFINKTIEKYWGLGDNKGLLVSNDLPDLMIAKDRWKFIKTEGNEGFWSSNDSYYSRLQRGPEYDRRKKKLEEEEKAKKPRFQTGKEVSPWEVSSLSSIDLEKKVRLTSSACELFKDMDFQTEEGLSYLSFLTDLEMQDALKKNPDEFVAIFSHVTEKYTDLYDRYKKATDHLSKITGKNSAESTQR